MEIGPIWRSSWWFQPIWKICSSNWIISPGRVKITNVWNHHLEMYLLLKSGELRCRQLQNSCLRNTHEIPNVVRIPLQLVFFWDIQSPKINMSPQKGPFQKEISSSSHWFLIRYVSFCGTYISIEKRQQKTFPADFDTAKPSPHRRTRIN